MHRIDIMLAWLALPFDNLDNLGDLFRFRCVLFCLLAKNKELQFTR